MPTCLISVIFLGTSAAQAIAAYDLVEQCPNVLPESVCQHDPTTMQQHIEKGAVTSGKGQGKISGKRIMYAEVAWYKFNVQVYITVLLFSFSQLHEIKYRPSSYYISVLKVSWSHKSVKD